MSEGQPIQMVFIIAASSRDLILVIIGTVCGLESNSLPAYGTFSTPWAVPLRQPELSNPSHHDDGQSRALVMCRLQLDTCTLRMGQAISLDLMCLKYEQQG